MKRKNGLGFLLSTENLPNMEIKCLHGRLGNKLVSATWVE